MYYKTFSIENYRGISSVEVDLQQDRVVTLVGLNESGKTTILESIIWFYRCIKGINPSPDDLKYFRPKGIDFSGKVILKSTVGIEEVDKRRIQSFWKKLGKRGTLEIPEEFQYTIAFFYEQHEYKKTEKNWQFGIKRLGARNNLYKTNREGWNSVVEFVKKNLIPEIIFYEDFLFNIPEEIIFALTEEARSQHSASIEKDLNRQWQNVLDDILMAVRKEFNSFQGYVVEKWISDNELARQRIGSMEQKLNEEITSGWKALFGDKRSHFKEIKLVPTPQGNLLKVAFKVKTENNIDFPINDRSRGFKWFFSFLIFTEFRKIRSQNILFLLDEPASNLHSNAQNRILDAVENLSRDAVVVYSTHSHHLINPQWLRGAYVVINEVITEDRLEGVLTFEQGASIKAEKYFTYVGKGEGEVNLSYFQPILDALDYAPSALEPIPNIIITEGRDDWYILKYFDEIIFRGKSGLDLYPGAGKDHLWEPIRIYLSWGRPFLVLLDGDKGGKEAKERYVDEFPDILSDRIFTLRDVFNKKWEIEDLVGVADKKQIVDKALGAGMFDSSKKQSTAKKKLHQAIKQLLITHEAIPTHKNTNENFKTLFKFLKERMRTID